MRHLRVQFERAHNRAVCASNVVCPPEPLQLRMLNLYSLFFKDGQEGHDIRLLYTQCSKSYKMVGTAYIRTAASTTNVIYLWITFVCSTSLKRHA